MQGGIAADGDIRNPPSHGRGGNPGDSEEPSAYRLRGKRVKYTDLDDTSDHSEEEKDGYNVLEDGNTQDSDAYYSAGDDLMDNQGPTLSPRSHRRELRYGIHSPK